MTKQTSDLGSIRFIEDDDRIMYVNDLDDGGIGFVIWNGDNKNILRITKDGRQTLLDFINKEIL